MRESFDVCIISFNFPPVWAGPVERFMRYSPQFRSRGHRLLFATHSKSPVDEGLSREQDFQVLRLCASSPDHFARRCLWSFFTTAVPPKTLIHLGLSLWQLLFVPLLRMRGIQVIYVSTMALADETRKSRRRPRVRTFLSRLAHKSLLKIHSLIVTSSSYLKEELIMWGIDSRRIVVIPNGVNLVRFRPPTIDEKKDRRSELEIEHLTEPLFLFVGLIVQRKGVQKLLSAWKLYKTRGGSGSLALVGNEQREIEEFKFFYEAWDRLSSTLTKNDCVYRYPAAAKIEKWYQAADIFVFFSELEGMPNVLPEAMASGLPLLLSRFKGFSAEFGRNQHELWLTEESDEAITDQMFELATNVELRKRLGSNARNWQEIHNPLEKSIEAYSSLIGRKTYVECRPD